MYTKLPGPFKWIHKYNFCTKFCSAFDYTQCLACMQYIYVSHNQINAVIIVKTLYRAIHGMQVLIDNHENTWVRNVSIVMYKPKQNFSPLILYSTMCINLDFYLKFNNNTIA